ncbi:MAG: hypothetical protein FVQ83_01820 [Chloroflexi bacterium]|nr:hypothetical protein [Chloroflexota bacterium]
MSMPISLVPLKCVKCETPVPAETDEIAWVCQTCNTGLLLDEEKGLVPLEIHYSAKIPDNASGQPFWVVEGQVSLSRDSYTGLGKKTNEAKKFWSKSRRFFIPAFNCSLDELTGLGKLAITTQPELKAGTAAHFDPVTQMKKDLRALAEFIVIAVEANRRDKVKKVVIDSIQLGEPELWILP